MNADEPLDPDVLAEARETLREPGPVPDVEPEAEGLELGRSYRDTVTGMVGVATAVTHYLAGTPRVLLEREVGPRGKADDGLWVDLGRLGLPEPPAGRQRR